jgi:CO/xanthine dehydrogenase Mo-binding subunit
MLRSPHAHAAIERIDAAAARRTTGYCKAIEATPVSRCSMPRALVIR